MKIITYYTVYTYIDIDKSILSPQEQLDILLKVKEEITTKPYIFGLCSIFNHILHITPYSKSKNKISIIEVLNKNNKNIYDCIPIFNKQNAEVHSSEYIGENYWWELDNKKSRLEFVEWMIKEMQYYIKNHK